MRYTKPPLTYEQQADLLISRGMSASRDDLISHLKSVSYYRLSGYWYPFRNKDADTFRDGTSFELVWQRYVFDRQLRLLIMDAIERIEIGIRTDLLFEFTQRFGPFGYMDKNNLPNLSSEEHERLLNSIESETRKSKEVFVGHFRRKYGDEHGMLPLWMAVEIIPLGTLLTLYKGVDKSIKKAISDRYDVSFGVFESWLGTLNVIRNICAHHGRLWNRELGVKPIIPDRKKPVWHTPVSIENNRIFSILTILRYLLKYIAPQSGWADRLKGLFKKYPNVPLGSMGFPERWEESGIWLGWPHPKGGL